MPAASRGVPAALSLLSSLQSCSLPRQTSASGVAASVAHYARALRAAGVPTAPLPPKIVIVGTKGKGSVAAMSEASLRAAGLRTGLFTSPHLRCPGERVRLDGASLSRAAFLSAFWRAADALAPDIEVLLQRSSGGGSGSAGGSSVDASPPPPPLPGFTLLYLVALSVFAEASPPLDVAILEAGVGGRLDVVATGAPPVVVGVTRLDFDHMELLGDTLPAIAAEKGGALCAGVPAVTAPQRADALAALCASAAGVRAPLWQSDTATFAARCPGGAFPPLGLAADYQRENAALAAALCDFFMRETGRARRCPRTDAQAAAMLSALPTAAAAAPIYACSEPLPSATLRGLAAAHWPGRAQIVECDEGARPLPRNDDAGAGGGAAMRLLLDGAHTEASMAAAVRWVREVMVAAAAPEPPPPAPRLALIFACGTDKAAAAMLLALSTLPFARVYITNVPAGLTPPRRPQPPSAAELLARHSTQPREAAGSAAAAAGEPACATEGGNTVNRAAAAADGVASLAWPYTLADLWRSVHSPAWLLERQQLARELGGGGGGSAPPLSSSPPETVVCTSAAGALADLAARPLSGRAGLGGATLVSPHSNTPCCVLVTGSLYLIGDVMAHLDLPPG